MRFALDDEQTSLAEGLGTVLRSEAAIDVTREAWGPDGEAAVREFWRTLGSIGAFRLGISHDEGGLSAGPVAMVAMGEHVGSVAAPGPLMDTIALAAPLLGSSDDPLVERVLDGDAIVAWGVGCGEVVPNARWADAVIVDGPGGEIWLHDRELVSISPVRGVDGGRGLARVEAHGPGRRLVARNRDRVDALGVLVQAAELVGLGSALIQMTVRHAKVRKQFGRPIGSFQAVQHQLADALLAVSFARPALYRAAWQLATGHPDAHRDVSIAKATAGDAAMFCSRVALQCHGAIAYTVEHDYHLFAKRIWALQASRGDAHEHRERVYRALVGSS